VKVTQEIAEFELESRCSQSHYSASSMSILLLFHP